MLHSGQQYSMPPPMGSRPTTYIFSCDESGGVAGTSTSKDSDLRGNEILIETEDDDDAQAFDIGRFPRGAHGRIVSYSGVSYLNAFIVLLCNGPKHVTCRHMFEHY